jgi:hypothetical protein
MLCSSRDGVPLKLKSKLGDNIVYQYGSFKPGFDPHKISLDNTLKNAGGRKHEGKSVKSYIGPKMKYLKSFYQQKERCKEKVQTEENINSQWGSSISCKVDMFGTN